VQKEFTQSAFPSLIIKGAKASGKTHLLHIFAKKHKVEFLHIKKNASKNLIQNFERNHFYILENIDEIKNEEMLFHLVNSAFEAKAFLIMSTTNLHRFEIKDLSSRLKNIFSLQIKAPHLGAIEMLLANAFARRQIKVSGRIVKFISENISRNYAAIVDAVDTVENYCKDHGKSLSMQTIPTLFKKESGA